MSAGRCGTIRVLVEAERHRPAGDEDRPPDQIGLRHHQIDCFLFGLRQRPLLEHGTPRADEIQEPIRFDVLLETRSIGRIAIDVTLLDVELQLLQKTSGVAARRSGRLQIEQWFRHRAIL